MLWGSAPSEILCPKPCERPTSFPRAPSPGLSAASRFRGRSSIRATATPRTTPRARSRSRCSRSPAAFWPKSACRNSLLAWIASIVLPAAILGIAPLVVTAWVGDVFVRLLELTGFGAALVLLGVALWAGSAGVRCFAWRRRISGRSTRLAFSRDMPCAARRSGISRSEPSAPRRGGARAHAGDELRRRRSASRHCRRLGRGLRLAVDAVDRIGRGSRGPASSDRAHPRQRHRHHVGLSCGGFARLGLRRREHGPAARSRSLRRRAGRRPRSGASRISPTSISWASAMAFASRADGAGPRGNERLKRVDGAPRGRARRPAARPRAHHRRHDRRRAVVRMGGILRHSRGPSGPRRPRRSSCRATTTSMSSTAPTRRASISRSARRKPCARCALCPRSQPLAPIACGS